MARQLHEYETGVSPTNASEQTPNFGFPIFVDDGSPSGDKPSWMVDWNGTMRQLDTDLQTMKDAGVASDEQIANINSLVTQMRTNIRDLQNLTTEQGSKIANNTAVIEEHQQNINQIQADLIAQNTLVKQHTAQINGINSELAGISDTIVPELRTGIEDVNNRVDDMIPKTGRMNFSGTPTQLQGNFRAIPYQLTIYDSVPPDSAMTTLILTPNRMNNTQLEFVRAVKSEEVPELVKSSITLNYTNSMLYLAGWSSDLTGIKNYSFIPLA